MTKLPLCCVLLAACVGQTGAMGDPGAEGAMGDPGTPGTTGSQGPGAVQLRYTQPAPTLGATSKDQKLATVGGFEYWAGCNIDASNTVSVSLWVIPASGSFAAITTFMGQFDDTGSFYSGNIHGGGLTGTTPWSVFAVATAHYLRDSIGPLVVRNATEMQTVVYGETADARVGSTGCTLYGTVTPAM